MTSNNADKTRAISHTLAFLLVITLNALAIILPLNGKSTGQLSDQYPNLFTPAGLTFSIWSIIYLFLSGFLIFQAIVLFNTGHPSRKKIILISWPYLVNCFANAGWIVAWHYEQVTLSVCIMLVILASLAVIHERLHLALPAKPVAEKLWLDFPFSIYFGWISIATIANITAFLVNIKWETNINPSWWTVIMIGIGTLINVYMILFKNNIPFGLVGIWAFYGIIVKRQSAVIEHTSSIILSAQICISIILLSIVLQLFKYWKKSFKTLMSPGNMIKSES